MLAPQPNGVLPGDVRPVPLDAALRLDGLQTTGEVDAPARVHQIEVRGVDGQVEGRLQEGDVEPGAVERHEQRRVQPFPDVLSAEVVPPDQRLGVAVPVEADAGDLVAVLVQAGRLDVEEAGVLAEVLVEPPALRGGQTTVKEVGIVVLEAGAGSSNERLDAFGGRWTTEGGVEVPPGPGPRLPELPLRGLAHPIDPDVGVLQSHGGPSVVKTPKVLVRVSGISDSNGRARIPGCRSLLPQQYEGQRASSASSLYTD